MRKLITIAAIALLSAQAAGAQETKVFKWVDSEGITHYGDSIPAEYAEYPKQVLNDHGVTVENLAGKKTEEEREAERRADEQRFEQRRELGYGEIIPDRRVDTRRKEERRLWRKRRTLKRRKK